MMKGENNYYNGGHDYKKKKKKRRRTVTKYIKNIRQVNVMTAEEYEYRLPDLKNT